MEETGRDVDMRACPVADRFAHFIRSAGPVIAFVTPAHPEGVPYDAWLRRTTVQRAVQGDASTKVCSPTRPPMTSFVAGPVSEDCDEPVLPVAPRSVTLQHNGGKERE
jgi:hypothetical protein